MDYSILGLSKEQITICNYYHKKAMEYFGIKNGDGLVLHHKDMDLRHKDINRYIMWYPEDLQVMTNSEHAIFHRSFSREPRHTTPHTLETRRKISKAIEGNNCRGKAVICVETGVEYKSSAEASRMTGANLTTITMCVNGIRKTSGGFHWKYA